MITRRELLATVGTAGAAALAGCSLRSISTRRYPVLAVTIDDFKNDDGPILSAAERHQSILRTLDNHGIRACGFPAGKFVSEGAGQRRLAEWADKGHFVGCHSYAHNYYSGKDPAAFVEDLDRALPLVRGFRTSLPLFRFPFLAEGNSAEGRDAARAALHQRRIANGHVTIDTSDWYVSNRLAERLKRNPAANIEPYRRFYTCHLLDRAAFYDGLVRDVIGRTIPHTLLIHHNLAAGLFLDDAFTAFRKAGWRLINADEAFADPIFDSQPEIVPAGQSLVWQLAKGTGRFENRLRYPGEDGDYEKPAMDRLGL